MKTKTQIARFLASIQLIFSVLIAAAIIYGYVTYRTYLVQFTQVLATSISAVSSVVGMTAEAIETRQSLIVSNTKHALVTTRATVKELNVVASNLSRQAPQFAESLRDASTSALKLGDTLTSVGNGMMFSVPTSLEMDGVRLIVVMTRPLKNEGQLVLSNAQDIKVIGSGLLNASVRIAKDGPKLGVVFVAAGEQALRSLEETEKTLDGLQRNDLPKALLDMKSASEELRNVSQQVNVGENISMAFLIFGLLLSGWCFLNSLSHLLTINLYAGSVAIPAVPQPRIDSLPLRGET